MLRKNFAVKRTRRREKVVGFYRVENGQALSGEALTDLACSESFAFINTSRFYRNQDRNVALAYEEAFVEVY